MIREVRTEDSAVVYDITYRYDQVGNPLSKVDSANPNSVRTTEPARVANP